MLQLIFHQDHKECGGFLMSLFVVDTVPFLAVIVHSVLGFFKLIKTSSNIFVLGFFKLIKTFL
jgi:hypothetical protein